MVKVSKRLVLVKSFRRPGTVALAVLLRCEAGDGVAPDAHTEETVNDRVSEKQNSTLNLLPQPAITVNYISAERRRD